MADEVVQRCSPISRRSTASRPAATWTRGAVPLAARSGARAGHRAGAAAGSAVPRLDPRSFAAPGPAISPIFPAAASIPRRSPTSSPTREPLHRHLAGGAGAGATGSQRARLAARLDGISADGARPVHHRRLDGHLQRHRLRARAAPGRRDSLRHAVHVRAGASLGAEVGEARRRHAGPRSARSRRQ